MKAPSRYVWRVDLKKTECYWQGWFDGLSQVFLSVDVPKILLLAGVDRLDKELTIAQMQGVCVCMHVCVCGYRASWRSSGLFRGGGGGGRGGPCPPPPSGFVLPLPLDRLT